MSEETPALFKQLFYEHYPAVVRKINALVGQLQVAEELAQEVFLRLYRTPPDDPDRIGAWLHRVATRIAYDYLRSFVKERERMHKEYGHLRLVGGTTSPSNEQIVLDGLEREAVHQALEQLSERDRTALLLRYSGYSYAEMADLLQVNRDLIGTIVSRAGARFKKQYMKEEETGR